MFAVLLVIDVLYGAHMCLCSVCISCVVCGAHVCCGQAHMCCVPVICCVSICLLCACYMCSV